MIAPLLIISLLAILSQFSNEQYINYHINNFSDIYCHMDMQLGNWKRPSVKSLT